MSVRLCGTSLSRAVNLHLSGSESNQRPIKEHSESIKIRVIQYSELLISTETLHNLKLCIARLD